METTQVTSAVSVHQDLTCNGSIRGLESRTNSDCWEIWNKLVLWTFESLSVCLKSVRIINGIVHCKMNILYDCKPVWCSFLRGSQKEFYTSTFCQQRHIGKYCAISVFAKMPEMCQYIQFTQNWDYRGRLSVNKLFSHGFLHHTILWPQIFFTIVHDL